MSKLIELSGASGGGQILRTALSLSMVTGQGFRLTAIRARRPKPGLMRQHLTCVNAAAEISNGTVDGAGLGSQEILFRPGTVRAGKYEFEIGTAGSTTLVAQTLLPPLWTATGPSELFLSGGTHNPMAPPVDYIERVFMPAIEKMGIRQQCTLEQYGFAPAGGGRVRFTLPGGSTLRETSFLERGEEQARHLECLLAHVPESVATREIKRASTLLGWPDRCGCTITVENSSGPGNALAAEVTFAHIRERITAFGSHGRSAERVAQEVAKKLSDYLSSGAVVGRCLADQLMIPMALAGGGTMHTMHPSNHVRTNAQVIESFLPVKFAMKQGDRGTWEMKVC